MAVPVDSTPILLGLARGGHLSVLLLFRLSCCQLTFFYSPYHSQEQPARMTSVFVGNIPYGVTEEQLKDIFSEAGPVVSFRIVYDRETGRPKGFGFCEFKDVDSAQTAMRSPKNNSRTSSARLAPSSLSGLCMTEKLDAQRDSASVSSKMWTLPRQP